jgi:hypothetical protein
VTHGHVEVDGRRATIPSMQLRDGQRVRITSHAGVAAEIDVPVAEQLVIERYSRR